MKKRKGTSKTSKAAETAIAHPGSNGKHVDDRPPGEVVLYQSEDGGALFEVRLDQETVWLTQQQIAELLGTTQPNISMHLKNIYEDQELAESATYQDFLIVQQEGRRRVRRPVAHYNLDATR